MQRNFSVHQSSMLFVKGEQQVLKWQIASRTTWINIVSGPVSIMTDQAGVLSALGQKRGDRGTGGKSRRTEMEVTFLNLGKSWEGNWRRGKERSYSS